MKTVIDPTYQPTAKLLAPFMMKPADISDDTKARAFVSLTRESRSMAYAQIAVTARILSQRGHDYAEVSKILANDDSEAQVKHIIGLGQALLATQEIHKTIAAVNNVGGASPLSAKEITDACSGKVDPVGTLDKLTVAAVTKTLRSRFTQKNGAALTDTTTGELYADAVDHAASIGPVNTPTLNAAIGYISEGYKITKKERAASPSNNGPMGAEYHLKRATADAKAIAKANGSPYKLTAADLNALLAFMEATGYQETLDEMTAMLDAENAQA